MRAAYLIPAAVLVGAVALSSVFIVDERKKALVLQFGEVKQVINEPGLGFKIPFIQFNSQIVNAAAQKNFALNI